MKKIVLGLVVLLAACGQQEAKAKKIVIGFGVPDGHFEQRALLEFKTYVEKQSKGSLEIELHGNNSIGVDQEVLEQIKLNVAQMNIPGEAALGNFVPEASIIGFPFLFDDINMANAVVNGPWGKELNVLIEKAGYVSLGVSPFGANVMSSSVPYYKFSDMKGVKVRTIPSESLLAFFRAWGFNPTPMSFSELFSALQQGVVQGQSNPLANIFAFRLNEVQKYITISNHYFEWVYFIMGKEFYDKLTTEEQKILKDGATQAIAYIINAIEEDDKKALEGVKATGKTEIIIPDAEMLQEMRTSVKPVVDKFGNKINPKLYNSLLKSIEEYKKNN